MSASFLADECVAGPVVEALRRAGFDIILSRDVIPAGDDLDVLALACQEHRVLLTDDTDFGELTVRRLLDAVGIVRLSLHMLPRAARPSRVVEALTKLGSEIVGEFITIEPARIRRRRLKA